MLQQQDAAFPGMSGSKARAIRASITLAVLAALAAQAGAQERPVPDTFETTTTGMTPDGVRLRIDVLEWSSDAARTAVMAAMMAAAEDTSDASEADEGDGGLVVETEFGSLELDEEETGGAEIDDGLTGLPTVGVVWREGSAVGHSIKYAHEQTAPDGRRRITVVTDKPLDAYSFRAWEFPGVSEGAALPYTVIELLLDASGDNGSGTMTPVAEVAFDVPAASVSLAAEQATTVLSGAREMPKPYWATPDGG